LKVGRILIRGTNMSSSLLNILCQWNAQENPHLYQMDESGKIRIMWDQADRPAIDLDKEVAGTSMTKDDDRTIPSVNITPDRAAFRPAGLVYGRS
jgi:hypothetical protein